MQNGMRILAEVKRQIGVPVLTDVHSIDEIASGERGYGDTANARVSFPANRLYSRGNAP
jgi:hypothetical protein